ncbi:MAG: RimK/LysX family protein [Cytophagales bacterium]|jgi:hypothetical protein|nr:RimK/LysX family protein [Cytophagales bacterium]
MLPVIGRHDRIDLPDFGAFDIAAKIDTGAYSSALHCSEIKVRRKNGRRYISFRILDSHIPAVEHRRYVTTRFRRKKVRSSSGHVEVRYFIQTHIVLFGQRIRAEFSLSDRETMRFPVLLGRKLLRNRFLVDVAQKDVSYQQKQRQVAAVMHPVSDLRKEPS